jgi:hypothetical protein
MSTMASKTSNHLQAPRQLGALYVPSGQGQAGLPATTEAKLATADQACVALLPEECGILQTKAGLLLRRWSQETVIS